MQLKGNKEMEFERLKKSHKKQIIIGVLAVCVIGGALTFATTRAKYKLTQDLELAKGTINYKPYDFKIMAMYQQNDSGTYTEINTMPSSGYVINEDKTYCTTDNVTHVKGKAHTNSLGELVFKNLTKTDKCYLYFDKSMTISDIIATLNIKTTIPTFSNVATTDEGVYSVSDWLYGGLSYYWRGAVTNNYVKFANFCWRIIRINGDKTMRLIYDGATCHVNGTKTAESIAVSSVKYNTLSNQSNYVGWTYTGTSQRTTSGTSSNVKTQLESWYSNNITGTDTLKVASGKFCNDREAQSGSTWTISGDTFYYAAYKRNITDKSPSYSCPSSDTYTLSVGLITADEVTYAGGSGTAYNASYYLYNGWPYWTMSPSYWLGSGMAHIFYVDTSLGNGTHLGNTLGLRPVINLRSDTTFNSGSDGTISNPYVVQ